MNPWEICLLALRVTITLSAFGYRQQRGVFLYAPGGSGLNSRMRTHTHVLLCLCTHASLLL